MHQKHISSSKLDIAKRIFTEANEHVQVLNNNKQNIMGQKSQRVCTIFDTARNTNVKELQCINTEIYVAK